MIQDNSIVQPSTQPPLLASVTGSSLPVPATANEGTVYRPPPLSIWDKIKIVTIWMCFLMLAVLLFMSWKSGADENQAANAYLTEAKAATTAATKVNEKLEAGVKRMESLFSDTTKDALSTRAMLHDDHQKIADRQDKILVETAKLHAESLKVREMVFASYKYTASQSVEFKREIDKIHSILADLSKKENETRKELQNIQRTLVTIGKKLDVK